MFDLADLESVTHVDEKLGVVTVTFVDSYGNVAGGSARLDPQDKFDPEIGTQLAWGRALKELGKILERDAFDEVHYRDSVRTAQHNASVEALAEKKRRAYEFECEFAALINAVEIDRVLGEINNSDAAPVVGGIAAHPSTSFSVREVTRATRSTREDLPA